MRTAMYLSLMQCTSSYQEKQKQPTQECVQASLYLEHTPNQTALARYNSPYALVHL